MYIYIVLELNMKRTQIYLDKEVSILLTRESEILHKTVSEIIRDSIREKFKSNSHSLREHVNSVFGIWKNRKIAPETYVRKLRKDRKI